MNGHDLTHNMDAYAVLRSDEMLVLLVALAFYWLWRELARLESKLVSHQYDLLICRCENSRCRVEIEECRNKLAQNVDALAEVDRGLRIANDELEGKLAENSRGLNVCLEEVKNSKLTKDLLEVVLRDERIVRRVCCKLATAGDLQSLKDVYTYYGKFPTWGGYCMSAILRKRETVVIHIAVLEWLKGVFNGAVGFSPSVNDICAALMAGNLGGFKWILANITDEVRAAWIGEPGSDDRWRRLIPHLTKSRSVDLLTLALDSSHPTSLLLLADILRSVNPDNFRLILSRTGDSKIDVDRFTRIFSRWHNASDEDTAVLYISTFGARVDGNLILPERCITAMKPKVSEWAQLQVKNGAAVWG